MKTHDAPKHPGPWRVMQVDSERGAGLDAVFDREFDRAYKSC